jgi:phosphohistidine phosphatase
MKPDEKFIVLLRHGIAEPHGARENDDDRALTGTGARRMKQVGRGLARFFPKAELVYSSPLLRCIQTAECVVNAYGSAMKLEPADALKPGAAPEEIRGLIMASKARRIICVSHEPTLSTAMLSLTRMSCDGETELRKGGCYGVRLHADGSAKLEWMLRPRSLKRRRKDEG